MNENAEKVNGLSNDVRVYGSVVIIGAGASFEAGMPLYKQLAPIIWQIVDNLPSIKKDIGVNRDDPAKEVIGEKEENIINVFPYIEISSEATTSFKQRFKNLNDKHNPNNVQIDLCRLIHAGFIKLVISFNWDDLLERAWESSYGTDINSNKLNLIKPNGDVRNPSGHWIFPNSKDHLSIEAINALQNVTSEGPTTVIILGYSERDKQIVDELIKPSEIRYVVHRISPSAVGEHGISLKASEALAQISNELLSADKSKWSHADYSNSKKVGLEHALMGYRLQSSDVIACARLPQVDFAKRYLDQAHYTIIEGEAGCGKSITAYQLANDYRINGWEVLKLDTQFYDQIDRVELVNDGYKSIFLIDDAQQLERNTLSTLLNKANSSSKLIVAETITNDFPSESITISQAQAVDTIRKHYIAHKREIVEIVRELNEKAGRRIGDLAFEVPFDDVLDVAAKEKTPWLFNYSLQGGWATTYNKYAVAREHNRADILLTLIALKQIITLDKAVEPVWLEIAISNFGYSKQWMHEQLSYLHEQKLITNIREIRTLHLQMAIRVLVSYLKSSPENDFAFIELVQKEFLNVDNPLIGNYWLYSMLLGYDIKYRFWDRLLTEQFKEKLMARCIHQIDSTNRSAAGFVIDKVLRLEGSVSYKGILEGSDFLRIWMNTVDNETAISYSQILNTMFNESHELHYNFISSLDIDSIIASMTAINSQSLFVWANFLNRLVIFPKQKWCREFCLRIPREEVHIALQECSLPNIYAMSEMLVALTLVDTGFAFSEFHKSLPILKRAMEQDFIVLLHHLDLHFLMYLLGKSLFIKRRPNKYQKDAGKAFVSCITPVMIKGCILNGTPKDWNHFYDFFIEIVQYDPQKYKNAFIEIEFSELNEKTEKLWATQPEELIKLLVMLSEGDSQKTESWTFANKDKIDLCSPTIIELSPRTAKYVNDSGKKINLIFENHWWDISARAIKSLRDYDFQFCEHIVEQNMPEIKKSFNRITGTIDFENYHLFLHELIRVDPTLVDKIINAENTPQFIKTCKMGVKIMTKKDRDGLYKLIGLISTHTSDPNVNIAVQSLKAQLNPTPPP